MEVEKQIREIIEFYCGGTYENRNTATKEILQICQNLQLQQTGVSRLCFKFKNMSKENLTINVALGAMAPSLKSQLKVFDFVPAEEIKFLQKLSDSISILAFHDLISDSQRIKSYEKLIKKIHKTIVKYAKSQTSDSVPTA